MSGHVFVVHGRLESIDAEVVVVPTSQKFGVKERQKWAGTWSDGPDPVKPKDWGQGAVLPESIKPVTVRPWIWFIDSTFAGGVEQTVERICRGVRKVVKEAEKLPTSRRQFPLVAIPTLGVQGGGLGLAVER